MAVLKNPQHEAFAQALFQGMSQAEAHKAAGFSGNPGNASTLKKNKTIQKRLEELQQLKVNRHLKRIDRQLDTIDDALKELLPLATVQIDPDDMKAKDKLAAIKLSSQLKGWLDKQKPEQPGNRYGIDIGSMESIELGRRLAFALSRFYKQQRKQIESTINEEEG